MVNSDSNKLCLRQEGYWPIYKLCHKTCGCTFNKIMQCCCSVYKKLYENDTFVHISPLICLLWFSKWKYYRGQLIVLTCTVWNLAKLRWHGWVFDSFDLCSGFTFCFNGIWKKLNKICVTFDQKPLSFANNAAVSEKHWSCGSAEW